MAQLFFRYGAMNSGKSIEILKVAHNYEEQNKPVLSLHRVSIRAMKKAIFQAESVCAGRRSRSTMIRIFLKW